ncbi:histidine kinase [Flavobacterium sp.]|uniref:sensor histidine kinase n=1 Tax=Flavobacterium sp. TaxID=239 RepID=UPI00286E01C0|nr:histidine kinase [Flavobacterium sp.]
MEFIKKASEFLENNRIYQHLIFWFGFSVANISLGLTSEGDTIKETFIFHSFLTIPQILASYYYAYFVIPKFVLNKKYFLAAILFLVGTYFFSAMARIFVVHIAEPLIKTQPFEQESILEILTDVKKLLIQYIPSIFSASFIFLFVKYFLDYKRTKDQETQLSKEKVEVELKMLKAQLNPHFLFNTLNNIYSLSLDNSPKVPESIGKLSEILDHILYKCDSQLVSLNSEIELLKNYIELEKLRYDDRLQVVFETNVEADIQIPPLLLLSLVENAFKHGAGEDTGSPKIAIKISNSNAVFTFEISNTVSNDYENNGKENIGLSNIRKQLDLIYGNDYKMDIKLVSNSFTVILQIYKK